MAPAPSPFPSHSGTGPRPAPMPLRALFALAALLAALAACAALARLVGRAALAVATPVALFLARAALRASASARCSRAWAWRAPMPFPDRARMPGAAIIHPSCSRPSRATNRREAARAVALAAQRPTLLLLSALMLPVEAVAILAMPALVPRGPCACWASFYSAARALAASLRTLVRRAVWAAFSAFSGWLMLVLAPLLRCQRPEARPLLMAASPWATRCGVESFRPPYFILIYFFKKI